MKFKHVVTLALAITLPVAQSLAADGLFSRSQMHFPPCEMNKENTYVQRYPYPLRKYGESREVALDFVYSLHSERIKNEYVRSPLNALFRHVDPLTGAFNAASFAQDMKETIAFLKAKDTASATPGTDVMGIAQARYVHFVSNVLPTLPPLQAEAALFQECASCHDRFTRDDMTCAAYEDLPETLLTHNKLTYYDTPQYQEALIPLRRLMRGYLHDLNEVYKALAGAPEKEHKKIVDQFNLTALFERPMHDEQMLLFDYFKFKDMAVSYKSTVRDVRMRTNNKYPLAKLEACLACH